MRKKTLFIIQLVLFAAIGSLAEERDLSVQQAIRESGIKGGLIVHVGDGNGETLAGLHANESCLVQGLYSSRDSVLKSRDYLILQRHLGLQDAATYS